MIMYGIKNCDTIKKAKKWLEANNIHYEFHDFRTNGLNPVQLRSWVAESGWQTLLNKRSTTWRQLPTETKENMNEVLAIAVMEDQPTIIKRPILETDQGILIGFSDQTYSDKLL